MNQFENLNQQTIKERQKTNLDKNQQTTLDKAKKQSKYINSSYKEPKSEEIEID